MDLTELQEDFIVFLLAWGEATAPAIAVEMELKAKQIGTIAGSLHRKGAIEASGTQVRRTKPGKAGGNGYNYAVKTWKLNDSAFEPGALEAIVERSMARHGG